MSTGVRTGLARLLPKPPAGPLPLGLPRRRIYILPSRFGLVYATALFFLQLGALNYNNNAAILLALLLASIALMSAVVCVRFLNSLTVTAFDAGEAFAGTEQDCSLTVRSAQGPLRGELRLRVAGLDAAMSYDGDFATGRWRAAAGARGRHPLGRVRLSSGYPLGMFHAWCDLVPDADRLVYPAPESPAVRWPAEADPAAGARATPRGGDEEWHALREFRRGDSLRDIAWKTSARHDRWLVAETRSSAEAPTLRFSLSMVSHLDREHALSRLCGWILVAEAEQLSWILDLGNAKVGPGRGEVQRRHALVMLAELP
ncbi:DUF58 domain-containing protein [Pseudofulvimonas gallinarii]|jgi:uncharacterized protein (DUF58 family)|uniref:Uncharacterized protein (DUF58 family) n=1 Tax=Pseudofulvimonas gallinarii TaxID=634155 RepID=A0A4R3LSM7_9GAMM|nr:DUF58 domain-containing protein [Pseudofulvimonas gallinarii]TCT01237.1 uncharacterized protein (DUF58 family) [Pseudofulvimonas gallinarii]THD15000.1 hypothetical protein B1808_00935 [Pseudofulvimonas gallinarii]